MHLDATDRKILHILAADSALTSEQLGQKIGLSASAAHRRVKALEDGQAILGYRARIAPVARDHPSTVYVSVTLLDQRRETLETFEAALARCPVVKEAHLMTGELDYLLKVEVAASDSYERVHRMVLSNLPGVQRLVTHFSIRAILSGD